MAGSSLWYAFEYEIFQIRVTASSDDFNVFAFVCVYICMCTYTFIYTCIYTFSFYLNPGSDFASWRAALGIMECIHISVQESCVFFSHGSMQLKIMCLQGSKLWSKRCLMVGICVARYRDQHVHSLAFVFHPCSIGSLEGWYNEPKMPCSSGSE